MNCPIDGARRGARLLLGKFAALRAPCAVGVVEIGALVRPVPVSRTPSNAKVTNQDVQMASTQVFVSGPLPSQGMRMWIAAFSRTRQRPAPALILAHWANNQGHVGQASRILADQRCWQGRWLLERKISPVRDASESCYEGISHRLRINCARAPRWVSPGHLQYE